MCACVCVDRDIEKRRDKHEYNRAQSQIYIYIYNIVCAIEKSRLVCFSQYLTDDDDSVSGLCRSVFFHWFRFELPKNKSKQPTKTKKEVVKCLCDADTC